MRILDFDSVGGASGDMILAALLDLGADLDQLRRDLATLAVGPVEIVLVERLERGLRGKQLDVHVPSVHAAGHRHRTFRDIRDMIESSSLEPAVKAGSIDVFRRLAEVEGRIHACSPEDVHFHEIGAVDSIVDIVGAHICRAQLRIDAVTVSPLPCGRGQIRCDHGILPLPAPATLELLKGMPIVQTDEGVEMVTPTGAALLSCWRQAEPVPCGSVPAAVGYGLGHIAMKSRPNLLRATIYETPAPAAGTDVCVVLECNIDDTVPELLGALTVRLMEAGALDVFTTAVQMKKQRPGTLLTVLSKPADREQVVDLIFGESTTFGVREYMVHRTVLERRHEPVQTPYGQVRIKIGRWRGRDITRAPEYEDCARCAASSGVTVRAVYEATLAACRSSGASSTH